VHGFELAQINIGRLLAPTDDPLVAEFMEALDSVNALAEASPGFRWRFQTEEGNATAVRPYEDDRILINFSVWESEESLGDYVYRSAHATFLRRRREWFERTTDIIVALWWVPFGDWPTVDDAIARLDHLRAHGPTPHAFTFRHQFDPMGAPVATGDDRNACRV
jgi:heme-degrading monooxygenase HmoA